MVNEINLQKYGNEIQTSSDFTRPQLSYCVLQLHCKALYQQSLCVRKVQKVTITNVCMCFKAYVSSFIQYLNSTRTLNSVSLYTLHKTKFYLERIIGIFLNISNSLMTSITKCFVWIVFIFGIRENIMAHYNKFVMSNNTCKFLSSRLCNLKIKPFTLGCRILETVCSTKTRTHLYKRFRDKLYYFDCNKNQTRPCLQTYTVAPVFQAVNSVMDRIARGERVPAEESMRYEMLRLCSFRSYPQDNKPFRIRYAQAGFYYAAKEDEVICYVCRKRFSNWTADDVPINVHRRASPNCRFLTHNAEVNVPAGSNEGQQRPCDVVSATQENDVQTSDQGACRTSSDVKQPNCTGIRCNPNSDTTKTQSSGVNTQIITNTENRYTRRSSVQEPNQNTTITRNGFDSQEHFCQVQHSGHLEESNYHFDFLFLYI